MAHTPDEITIRVTTDHSHYSRDGGHNYLATACFHGYHSYCQSTIGKAGLKMPGKCKFCDAKCGCECHGLGSERSE
jgi:hypothetical protein